MKLATIDGTNRTIRPMSHSCRQKNHSEANAVIQSTASYRGWIW
jgi:hypothetical protein